MTKVAILGIGSELRGDDGAGPFVARLLAAHTQGWPGVLVFDAGTVPENFTGPLRRFSPDLIVLIDAAQMNAAPGETRWLDPQDTTGFSASTHSLPLQVFAAYLVKELGCAVRLLGIQPAQTGFDQGLSPAVEAAVPKAAAEVLDILPRQD